MSKVKKIHFVGIKGVGMTPLAIIAKESGIEVTGSDVAESFITDEELSEVGIEASEGFDPERVEGADLVIATGAHGGFDNPEVIKAKELGISVLSQGQALGEFQKGEILGRSFEGICITGSHGKTTTTAMVATVLFGSGSDPSYAVGTGKIPSLGLSGHFGKGKFFVAEADEYFSDVVNDKTPKFLYLHPKICVVTNVDYDHPDIYDSINDVRSALLEFANKIPKDGVLIANGDGEENRKFLASYTNRKVTYGFSPSNDYILERVNSNPDKTFFRIKSAGADLGEFSIKVFGEQNVLDALASIIVGLESGLTIEQIRKSLSAFSGTKRRSEFVKTLLSGALLYDDYAHHPEEISQTLNAFRKSFPKYKIVVIFQPHMYSRTKKFFPEFVRSFDAADQTLIAEIFPSFREKVDPNFSSNLIVLELQKNAKDAKYFPTLTDMVKFLSSQKLDRNTLVITMGAGDVYKIGRELI